MKKLYQHHNKLRVKYPEEKLLIVFDIDGTIVDTREIVLYLLKKYDENNKTSYFKLLTIDAIDFHETEHSKLKSLLLMCNVPVYEMELIVKWYKSQFWESVTMIESNLPFPGVFEIINWVRNQPNTFVGLNTGRYDIIRRATLYSLNNIAKKYSKDLQFSNELLYMNLNIPGENVPESKVRGLNYFEELGYRVISMLDNEPSNLEAIQRDFCNNDDILLLHADTIFISKFEVNSSSDMIISGREYNLSDLIV